MFQLPRSSTRSWALLTAMVLAIVPPARAADKGMLRSALDSVRTSDLRRHAFALADDTFEGREAGSRGGRAAAGYLRDEMKRYGLQPAGDGGGYDQQFDNGYRNLLGIVPGDDPQLSDQIVVVAAHFDHVGYGTQRNSYGPVGHIHNGADDNASGTAGLLELAEAIGRQQPPPRRSVLFALWDGEEKGLLGSKHWVAQLTLPLDRVVLMINLDMIGRLRDNRVELYGTRSGHGLRRLVSSANSVNLQLDFTWEMKDNSDHYSFFERGVPVLMAHTGLHDDYHRPSDDPEKLNLDGMTDITRFLVELIYAVADAPELPEFRDSSRSEAPRHRAELEAALPPLPSRLGVRWDHELAEEKGDVWITGVESGSPAERGGFLAGDRVVSFGDVAITAGA
ncbi:MAG: M20/M25/M40 family metallo-hydrolase, partial [Planctomycetales bacterium]|nr:M20/M25/M40 family metallo-hydrolase [Planctomycetales bacterium]